MDDKPTLANLTAIEDAVDAHLIIARQMLVDLAAELPSETAEPYEFAIYSIETAQIAMRQKPLPMPQLRRQTN